MRSAIRRFLSNLNMSLLALSFISCAGIEAEDPLKPPRITAKMPRVEAVDAAINFGGPTLKNAKKRFEKNKEWPKVGSLIQAKILENGRDYSARQLVNAVNIYLAAGPKTGIPVFKFLLNDERVIARQMAWHVAAVLPSKQMRATLDLTVSKLLIEGDLTEHFGIEFAYALKNNLIKSHYTVARQGLVTTNLPAFVEAMVRLDSRAASSDLMDYLARAPIEELRQIHMSTVNVFACIEALRHLEAFPVGSTHPKFEHLFFYAISRNSALSELAKKVLNGYLVKDKEHLALVLSKQPTWIQLAFVEGASRDMTRNLEVFLGELKLVTAQRSVVEEINSIKR